MDDHLLTFSGTDGSKVLEIIHKHFGEIPPFKLRGEHHLKKFETSRSAVLHSEKIEWRGIYGDKTLLQKV